MSTDFCMVLHAPSPALLALTSILLGCGGVSVPPPPPPPSPDLARFALPMMGTVIEVAVPDDDRAAARARLVLDAFGDVDAAMSEWREGSPLATVNAQAGVAPVPVPPELLALVGRSLALAEATDDAFDPSWAALWGLWDFRADPPRVPSAEDVAARLPLVDFRAVVVDPDAGTIFLPRPGMKLGLGAIAKGYALDVAAARLREDGADRFTLSAGGQVTAFDASGRPLHVGVRAPRGGPDARLATLALVARDAPLSVSSSGDYERFFEVAGRRYHHVLDPRTGYPSLGARAVTVVGPEGTLADGLSTALMVAGPAALAELMARFGDYAAVLVTTAGEVVATPRFCTLLAPPLPDWCADAETDPR
ncbi:MAG: FAD:protein FMN transferase [Deltaproteobacteria bacterium]|nr:MAG: FAD:protein FMN transferase [Deltaproteobacteria bacterium]